MAAGKLLTAALVAIAVGTSRAGDAPPNRVYRIVRDAFYSLYDSVYERTAQTVAELTVRNETFSYESDMEQQPFSAFYAYPAVNKGRLPGIVVVHNWDGRDHFEDGRATALAELGYAAMAIDVFGRRGRNSAENRALIEPLLGNRTLLLQRLMVGVRQLAGRREVDADKLAAIGYCFGGTSVLDMARANVDGLRAVVSFHGGLKPPGEVDYDDTVPIVPKVLIATGYADKSITPEHVVAVEGELERRSADWQVLVFGNRTDHAFTEEGPRYQPDADRRSWTAMRGLFDEVF